MCCQVGGWQCGLSIKVSVKPMTYADPGIARSLNGFTRLAGGDRYSWVSVQTWSRSTPGERLIVELLKKGLASFALNNRLFLGSAKASSWVSNTSQVW
jgi:hypothetical protein